MTALSAVPALGELARLATAATPGPWAHRVNFAGESSVVDASDEEAPIATLHQSDREQWNNAAFIAACSPAVILQLVALATGGAEAERGWAMALMELGKVPDPRLGGLHQVDVRQLTRRDRDFSSDALRPLTDDEAHAAIAKFRAARSLTPERPADV